MDLSFYLLPFGGEFGVESEVVRVCTHLFNGGGSHHIRRILV